MFWSMVKSAFVHKMNKLREVLGRGFLLSPFKAFPPAVDLSPILEDSLCRRLTNEKSQMTEKTTYILQTTRRWGARACPKKSNEVGEESRAQVLSGWGNWGSLVCRKGGSVGLTVGLNILQGLFQPKWFYDSIIAILRWTASHSFYWM